MCKGHTDLVRAVAIDTQEGLVYSGSYDGAVRVSISARSGDAARMLLTLLPDMGPAHRCSRS